MSPFLSAALTTPAPPGTQELLIPTWTSSSWITAGTRYPSSVFLSLRTKAAYRVPVVIQEEDARTIYSKRFVGGGAGKLAQVAHICTSLAGLYEVVSLPLKINNDRVKKTSLDSVKRDRERPGRSRTTDQDWAGFISVMLKDISQDSEGVVWTRVVLVWPWDFLPFCSSPRLTVSERIRLGAWWRTLQNKSIKYLWWVVGFQTVVRWIMMHIWYFSHLRWKTNLAK